MPELPLTFKLFATVCIMSAAALVCWQDEISTSFNLLKEAYEENDLPDTLPVVASLFSRKFDFLFLFVANIAVFFIAGAKKSKSALNNVTARS